MLLTQKKIWRQIAVYSRKVLFISSCVLLLKTWINMNMYRSVMQIEADVWLCPGVPATQGSFARPWYTVLYRGAICLHT